MNGAVRLALEVDVPAAVGAGLDPGEHLRAAADEAIVDQRGCRSPEAQQDVRFRWHNGRHPRAADR